MAKYLCDTCQAPYPDEGLPHVCPKCGGTFALVDLSWPEPVELPGLWRYADAFGLPSVAEPFYLGEGATPLIRIGRPEMETYVKLESPNPTGSFKDRGTALLTSVIKSRGIERVVEDSSGNAGSSLACYAAAAGIKADIFIPESTSGPKALQIENHHATIHRISGPREAAHQAALHFSEQHQLPYASHALQPFGLAGYATIAPEIHEALKGNVGTVVAPIGHGNLLLGVMMGFRALKGESPGFIGVQPDNCAPMADQLIGKAFEGCIGTSIAEGTQVSQPVRANEILSSLDPEKDTILTVSDTEIEAAWVALSGMGVSLEPTSAMVWAAYKKLGQAWKKPVVLIITGSGLKSTFKSNRTGESLNIK